MCGASYVMRIMKHIKGIYRRRTKHTVQKLSTGGADYQRYVVEYEPEDQTCLIVYEYVWDEARVQEWGIQSVQTNIPYREAQRLYFIEENGTLLIDEAIWVASSDESDLDGAVTSLEEFRILYEKRPRPAGLHALCRRGKPAAQQRPR